MNEQQSESITKIKPKRQSHQIKALFYKTATLQWKQSCTNICQIITPIICLIFTMLIRKVAMENLVTNENNVYNKLPVLPFKFNDFSLDNFLEYERIFSFDCNRWFLYDWQNDADINFIGVKDGKNKQSGLLKHILKTNQYRCAVNESLTPPFPYTIYNTTPYFKNPHLSINQQLFSRYLYFNNATAYDYKYTSIVQKFPDGAVYFNQANNHTLNVDLKINDERSLELHQRNGLTKIGIRDPELNKTTYQSYYTIAEGMLNAIDMMTHAFVDMVTGNKIVSGYVYMPVVGNSSGFIEMLINIVATIIFPLSLSLLLPVFLYNIVLQKQTKIIQMMRMNGLGIMTYWLVNFLFNFIISLITYVVFFMFGYFVMGSAFFVKTSFALIWIVLIGWILCQISLSMFIQVFISNSRAANIIGYLLTIWTNLIGATLSVALYQYPVELPFAVGLWPTISFNRIFYLLFINCSSDRCFNSLSGLSDELVRCIWIIYITAGIFFILGIYLHEVVPQQFGISKKILFPFIQLKNKISKRKSNNLSQQYHQDQADYDIENQSDPLAISQKRKVHESNFLDHPLICKGLTKIYDNGKKATNDFNLMIEDNEVFGLLGPNGAGKTTLISMITGIFEPTRGTAYIAGYNIKDQIDMVHMNMGVCPQFDILWDELTVEEHLYFYARLRGIQKDKEKQKVQETLEEIALQNFANFKVRELSGGMKRRLSVAISLVGDPRIVFLDEPTTGLDPQNRRNLWQLLSKCKQKRSLFLTTHLMEQAQSLCDRIGIITSSHLRTVGLKPQLKKIYGRGYNLTISVQVQRRTSPKQSHLLQQQDDSQQLAAYSSSQIEYRASINSLDDENEINASKMINDSIHLESYKASNELQRKMELSVLHNQKKLAIIKEKVLAMFGQENCLLIKQINGTVKFRLDPKSKISKVLESLELLKHDFHQSQEHLDFEWSINNSSLEDVFFNVVEQFPKQKKSQFQSEDQDNNE